MSTCEFHSISRSTIPIRSLECRRRSSLAMRCQVKSLPSEKGSRTSRLAIALQLVRSSDAAGGLTRTASRCSPLTDAISEEIGARVEPFSATVRAVAQGQPGPEDNVAIVGAGPIGLRALMAARLGGVKRVVVVEMAERRIEAAKQCGADYVIDALREDPEKRALEI